MSPEGGSTCISSDCAVGGGGGEFGTGNHGIGPSKDPNAGIEDS